MQATYNASRPLPGWCGRRVPARSELPLGQMAKRPHHERGDAVFDSILRRVPWVVAAVMVLTVTGQAALAGTDDGIGPSAVANVNADRVDGRHAVKYTSNKTARKGKLMAFGATGYLPNNIIQGHGRGQDEGRLHAFATHRCARARPAPSTRPTTRSTGTSSRACHPASRMGRTRPGYISVHRARRRLDRRLLAGRLVLRRTADRVPDVEMVDHSHLQYQRTAMQMVRSHWEEMASSRISADDRFDTGYSGQELQRRGPPSRSESGSATSASHHGALTTQAAITRPIAKNHQVNVVRPSSLGRSASRCSASGDTLIHEEAPSITARSGHRRRRRRPRPHGAGDRSRTCTTSRSTAPKAAASAIPPPRQGRARLYVSRHPPRGALADRRGRGR